MTDVLFLNSTLTLSMQVLANNCKALHISTTFLTSEAPDYLEKEVLKQKPTILAISWNFNETIYKFLCTSLNVIKKHYQMLKL